MLINKNSIMVLISLSKTLLGQGFEIIEKTEILSTLETTLTGDEFNLALAELAGSNYIKLKFNDSEEFCVAITPLGKQSAEQLEKLRLKELSAKAVVGQSASGKVVVTTIDDTPVYNEPEPENKETQNLPAVAPTEPIKSKRKPAGRIATFFYGTFGGVFGSGIVVGIMYLLSHLGIIV